jgi:hypothetical protein
MISPNRPVPVKKRLPANGKSPRCSMGHGDITLRRVGDYAVVEIEYNGKVYEVIRELIRHSASKNIITGKR